MSEAIKISWWDETVSQLGRMLNDKDARIAGLERERDALNREIHVLQVGGCASQRSDRVEELERGLSERTRQVAQLQDELADARNARDKAQSELAARPVVEPEAARKLREAWGSVLCEERAEFADGWEEGSGPQRIGSALRAFCESAPPASLPVREIVVEPEAARKLRERLRGPFALPFVSPTDWATLDYKRTAEVLREFRDSAPPTSAPSESDTQRLVQLAEYQDRAMRAEEEVEKLKRELEALKANSVDRGQVRSIQGSLDSAKAEIAALKAAPAQDEYTRAMEEFVNQYFGRFNEFEFSAAYARLEKLYVARKRGEASASKVEPAQHVGKVYQALAAMSAEPAIEESTFDSTAVGFQPAKERRYNPPPPETLVDALQDRVCETSGRLLNASPVLPKPEGERVTLYVVRYSDGTLGQALYPEEGRDNIALGCGDRWLALTATVVREGGAQ